MNECFDFNKPEDLQIFDALILNNTINMVNLMPYTNFTHITNEFIDKLSVLIKNNKTLNKIFIFPQDL